MTQNKQKWLWISPRAPEPVFSGAQMATKQLLKPLSNRIDIDLLCLPPVGELPVMEKLKEYSFSSVVVKPRSKRNIFDIIKTPFFPFTYTSIKNFEIQDSLKQLLSKNKYDLVVFDGLHAAVPFVFQKFDLDYIPPFVYRSHNVEADLWKQESFKRNPIFFPFLIFQYYLVKRIEKLVLKKALATLTISPQDMEIYKSWDNKNSLHNVPLGFEFSSSKMLPLPNSKKIKLGFLGRLDWEPNKNGLIWFLKSVWPKLDKTKFELVVAGSGNADYLTDYLKKFDNNFTFLGRVANVEDFYEKVQVSIIPVFYGSGVRVKVIESYLQGRPCVSTQMAMQGSDMTPNIHYWQAEEANDWIDVLSKLNAHEIEKTAISGRSHLSLNFDSEVIAKNVLSFVQQKNSHNP